MRYGFVGLGALGRHLATSLVRGGFAVDVYEAALMRTVSTASNWQVRQKSHSASIGHWRHYEWFLGPSRGLGRKGIAP